MAEAAGIGGERFFEALKNNQSRANDEAIQAHPIAETTLKFMENREKWSGTSSELLTYLERIAMANSIATHNANWANQPNVLSRKLREVKSNLEAAGIGVTIDNKNRKIYLINNNFQQSHKSVPNIEDTEDIE